MVLRGRYEYLIVFASGSIHIDPLLWDDLDLLYVLSATRDRHTSMSAADPSQCLTQPILSYEDRLSTVICVVQGLAGHDTESLLFDYFIVGLLPGTYR